MRFRQFRMHCAQAIARCALFGAIVSIGLAAPSRIQAQQTEEAVETAEKVVDTFAEERTSGSVQQTQIQKPAKPNPKEAFKAEIEAFLKESTPEPASSATKPASNVAELKASAAIVEPTHTRSETTTAPSSAASQAEKSPEAARFLRVTKTEEGEPEALQTAVVRYESITPGGAQIDLIGAVHIGERSYYEKLNRLFDNYDVLLYELVAPEGTQIPLGGQRERGGFNPVAMLQDASKNMLGLESQLELVDYTKSHFVRADMTPTQIGEKMAERGDTPFTLALDTFADVMRQSNLAAQNPEKNPLLALSGQGENISLSDLLGNPLKMKRMMAAQFANTGSLDMAMGESLNQLLIVDRNEEALRGLQKQLVAGKQKIGIFYGAAHLPDFEKHLLKDFGLKKIGQTWVSAWDLTQAKKPKFDGPTGLLMNALKLLD
ncbi:MAG: hypothetical protein ACE361_03755 [Aureliella sp.]